ncbi:helix-turn-helix domain-containing protein [Cronobacter dublinensis]|uniref:helix-turn-helix domain-containing protein n=1 Tax=Cronobacter dublinensis TaxID=413497 RepID=UPI0024C41BA3|nr:helix-turn-helix domain-containing protein [Cronobacter dublinensis]MDK1195321.1 helix-turn-helix domain-containing protein [Cronobacter dublinensis]MDK1200932.1 helix-turn-helix domain-containing protein [Cronobacter dublinensis]HDI3034506.1 helix-turn-helix domain-containing protein [Cronobacter turicensis]
MSMSLMAKAMAIKVGNPLRKLVLIKLADNASDNGECWPSYKHIAEHCECSKSAVRDHIGALISMGLVVKENRLGVKNGKGNASNVYYLKLDNPVPSESTALCRHTAPPVPSESTALCRHTAPPVPSDGTPCAATRHPPVPSDGTRTSHLEPVSETVTEPDTPPAPSKPVRMKFEPMTLELPDWLPASLWEEWVRFRRDLRKPIKTLQGAYVAIRELDKFRQQGFTPDEVIHHSIAREYQGLYAPRMPGLSAQRDVNLIPEPDNEIPPGFRG